MNTCSINLAHIIKSPTATNKSAQVKREDTYRYQSAHFQSNFSMNFMKIKDWQRERSFPSITIWSFYGGAYKSA